MINSSNNQRLPKPLNTIQTDDKTAFITTRKEAWLHLEKKKRDSTKKRVVESRKGIKDRDFVHHAISMFYNSIDYCMHIQSSHHWCLHLSQMSVNYWSDLACYPVHCTEAIYRATIHIYEPWQHRWLYQHEVDVVECCWRRGEVENEK